MILITLLIIGSSMVVAGAVPDLPSDANRLCTEYEVIDGQVIFEGDIILGSCTLGSDNRWQFEAKGLFAEAATGAVERAGVTPTSWFWSGATVPYVISGDFAIGTDPDVYHDIRSAVHHWNAQSTIQVVPRTAEADYIEFVAASSCSSSLGKTGGRQTINLYAGGLCGFGATVHELGHALGYYHEQSRLDRDTYVSIIWAKIEVGKEHNFNQYASGSDLNAYDYGSIMHYGATAFSIDDSDTIVPDPTNLAAWQATYGNIDIGHRGGLSVLDRQAADEMYNVCWSGPAAGGYHWVSNAWRSCTATCGGSNRTREVYCQDLNGNCVTDGFCNAGSKPATTGSCADQLSCNFDIDNCGWDSVDGGDVFEWTPGSGLTPSADTGPLADHTGGGQYLFTEMSSPRTTGDTAFLTSAAVDIPAGSTISFWHHYYGTSLPTLDVEVIACAGGTQAVVQIEPVGTLSNNSWRQVSMALPEATNARIRFRVTRNSSWSGDIAIDDIVVTLATGGIFADGFESGNLSVWSP